LLSHFELVQALHRSLEVGTLSTDRGLDEARGRLASAYQHLEAAAVGVPWPFAGPAWVPAPNHDSSRPALEELASDAVDFAGALSGLPPPQPEEFLAARRQGSGRRLPRLSSFEVQLAHARCHHTKRALRTCTERLAKKTGVLPAQPAENDND
jgi:hypothetical protein